MKINGFCDKDTYFFDVIFIFCGITNFVYYEVMFEWMSVISRVVKIICTPYTSETIMFLGVYLYLIQIRVSFDSKMSQNCFQPFLEF